MNQYRKMQEQLKDLAAYKIVEKTREEIEEKLPDDKTIEDVSDEELEKALDELKSEVEKP